MTPKHIAFALSLTALGGATAAQAEGELNIYNWASYTPPELIEKFEQETGIKVTIDTYDSNETLLAKLMAGGGGYDIIVSSHGFIPIYIGEGLIQPIDLAGMSNAGNIDPKLVGASWDPEGNYVVPYQWGTTSFAVDTAVYGEPVDSFSALFEPPEALQGKIGMFKSGSDLIALAETYLGVPFCSEDPAEMSKVLELLKQQKPFVKVYSASAAMGEQLVSGELAVASAYSGQALRRRTEKDSLQYVYPKEGVLSWVDVIAVPADAKNYDNARTFIDFTLAPENAAMISNFAGYANGIPAAAEFLKPELAGAPELSVPDGVPLLPMQTCSPAATELESQVMTELMQ